MVNSVAFSETPNNPKASLTNVGPIYVLNNWSNFVSTYSWCTGSGTKADPYVIQNVSVDATGSEFGIRIEGNSSVYFEIRNSVIQNANSINGTGIRILSTGNGTISNCSIKNNVVGIKIELSSNITLENSKIFANTENGIYLSLAKDSYIRNNLIYNSQSDCILIYGINTNITIEDNQIYGSSNQNGIALSFLPQQIFIKNNRIHNNYQYGISLNITANISIEDNTVYSNGAGGIYLYFIEDSLLDNNTLYLNNYLDKQHGCAVFLSSVNTTLMNNNNISDNTGMGIYALDSVNITLDANLIARSSRAGIKFLGCNWTRVLNNNITNNDEKSVNYGTGLVLSSSFNNYIAHNNITNNGLEGIELENANNTLIEYNWIANNTAFGIKVKESGNVTISHNWLNFNHKGCIDVQGGPEPTLVDNYCEVSTEPPLTIILIVVVLAIIISIPVIKKKKKKSKRDTIASEEQADNSEEAPEITENSEDSEEPEEE
ncbi:MAG: right-handed parallel beta-helix repeat-containing protein [Promethearchaeota archaeon]